MTCKLVLIFIETGWTGRSFSAHADICTISALPSIFLGDQVGVCKHEPQAAHVSPPRSSWAWTRPVGSWLPWKVCFEILRIKDFWNHLWQHHVNATFAFTANLPAICGIIKVMQGCQSMSAFVNRAILIFWLRVHLDGAMLVLRDEIHSQSLIQNICPFLNSNVPPAPGLIQLEICLSWEMPSSIHLLSTLLLYSGNRLHLQL